MADTPDQQPDEIEKSLGDQATGADVSRVDRDMSLGDQSTTGDALSSLSDLGSDLGEAIDSDLPLIDLAARYEIEGELGQGGMGAVLLATDRQLKRKVAIKRILGSMSKSKTALQRFVTEAQSIAKLNHFNIVQVHEFGRDVEGPFLVLEYVGGGSLLDKLKAGKLEIEEAVKLTCQLCDGLAVAHDQGIVHRDIKPANILLTKRGEPKLTDFGLARQQTADHGQTQVGAVLGTIDFMPPEQRHDITATDARSDLWSLAATLYQMITGEVPRVIDLDDVPQQLRPTLSRALKSKQDDRYQTAQEFRDALRGSLATTTESVPDVSVDLLAGECGECHTKNDSSRKFCSECAAPLRVACLECEEEIPIWDKVCGDCGGKQPELIAAHRSKFFSTLETSLTLAREHEYDKSLSQLAIVTGDKHPSTEDIRQQAAKQVEVVTAQRDEQHQLRDQLVELANQHQNNHDYAAEVQELEKIPTPLRMGNKIAQQLSNAQTANDELDTLKTEIRSDVKNKQIDGLLEKATRFLELNPRHEKTKQLHKQLSQRQEKVMLRDLKAAISAETTAIGKAARLEHYLHLHPHDKKADQMLADLREQMQADNLRKEQLEEHRQRRRSQIFTIGLLVVGPLMVVVTGLWFQTETNVSDAIPQVTGKITYDGKPLADARIRIARFPVETPRVYACDSKADGTFEIEAIYATEVKKGAPTGTYKVLIGKWSMEISEKRIVEADNRGDPDSLNVNVAKSHINSKFNTLSTTPLKLEVKEGKNYFTIKLKSDGTGTVKAL